MKETLPLVKRTINYYRLNIEYHKEYAPSDGDQCRGIFDLIDKLRTSKSKSRYQRLGEKIICIQGLTYSNDEKKVMGKLLAIRKDVFPEILNTLNDTSRGVEASDEEGMLETTHFVLTYNRQPTLAIEYNQFGAKIGDFKYYIEAIGLAFKCVIKMYPVLIVKNELYKMKDRMGSCAEFRVKIHKDNLELIKKMDGRLYSSLKDTIDHFDSEYSSLVLRFDYKKDGLSSKIRKTVNNVLNALIENREKAILFETLEVKAQDAEFNNRLQDFDLLADRLKSVIQVQKKANYRTIISDDMYQKMNHELKIKKP